MSQRQRKSRNLRRMESLVSRLSLPLEASDELYVSSAVQWLAHNTTLDIEDTESFPDAGRLFIVKYTEVMKADGNVTSESIAGMSQSFNTKATGDRLWELALALLQPWLKSQVSFKTATKKWETWG